MGDFYRNERPDAATFDPDKEEHDTKNNYTNGADIGES